VLLGRPVDINRAYADWDTQWVLYQKYLAYMQGRGPWAARALHPNKSWHCKGMAVDTDDGPEYGGPLTRATWREYGWLFEVADEPWHGQYYTSLDKHYGETAGSGSNPFPIPPPDEPEPDLPEGADMYIIKATEDAVILPTGKPVVRRNDQLAYIPGHPLKVLSSQEADLLGFFQDTAPVPWTLWGRTQLEQLILSNGLIETFDYQPGGIPSGRIRYSATQTAYPVVTLKP
jgi:hypothetical protein